MASNKNNVLGAFTKPATPTNLGISLNGNNEIKATWQNEYPQGYVGANIYAEIYMSTTADGTYKMLTPMVCNYDWKSMDIAPVYESRFVSGTTYYFKLAFAVDNINNTSCNKGVYTKSAEYVRSDLSSYKSYTIPTIPGKPGPVNVTTTSTINSICFDLSESEKWKSRYDSGYILYKYNSNTKAYDRLNYSSTFSYSKDFCDHSLISGTSYSYKIVYTLSYQNEEDIFLTSTPKYITASTVAIPTPKAPTGFKASSVGYTTINLAWDRQKDATSWILYEYYSSTGSYLEVPNHNETTIIAQLTGYTPGSSHKYKVVASIYDSTRSKTLYSAPTYLTVSTTAVPKPTNFVLSSTGYTTLSYSWTKPSNVSGYYLYITDTVSGKALTKITIGSSIASYTKTGLTSGRRYSATISSYLKANNTVYETAKSSIVFGTTKTSTGTTK